MDFQADNRFVALFGGTVPGGESLLRRAGSTAGNGPIEKGAVVAISLCKLALSFLLGLAYKVVAEQKQRARANKRTQDGGARAPCVWARLRRGTRCATILYSVLEVAKRPPARLRKRLT